jgi:hypothetical protein
MAAANQKRSEVLIMVGTIQRPDNGLIVGYCRGRENTILLPNLNE